MDFLEAWLNLAEKLVNASVILDSTHSMPVPPPSHANGKKLLFNPLFNPLAFIIQAQKVSDGAKNKQKNFSVLVSLSC